MTLQNLRYLIEVANYKSVSKAAQALYMSQSALSSAIKDVEDELGIQVFYRTNRGISLTPDGEDCLKYCKEIIERSDYLSVRYQTRQALHTYFSVSAQHLPFAVRAFQELTTNRLPAEYDVAMRETSTSAILHDVSTERSELGVVAFQPEQLELFRKALYIHDLSFTELDRLNIYVFVRKQHPLAGKDILSLEDLTDYPFVTYDQDDGPSYYTEESQLFKPLRQNIHVCDRATKMAVIRSTDAFSIGVDLPNFNMDEAFKNKETEMAAIPFQDQTERIIIGYLSKNGHTLSSTAEAYIRLLVKHIDRLVPPGANKS